MIITGFLIKNNVIYSCRAYLNLNNIFIIRKFDMIIKDIQIYIYIAQKDIKVIKKTRSAQKPTTEALKKNRRQQTSF